MASIFEKIKKIFFDPASAFSIPGEVKDNKYVIETQENKTKVPEKKEKSKNKGVTSKEIYFLRILYSLNFSEIELSSKSKKEVFFQNKISKSQRYFDEINNWISSKKNKNELELELKELQKNVYLINQKQLINFFNYNYHKSSKFIANELHPKFSKELLDFFYFHSINSKNNLNKFIELNQIRFPIFFLESQGCKLSQNLFKKIINNPLWKFSSNEKKSINNLLDFKYDYKKSNSTKDLAAIILRNEKGIYNNLGYYLDKSLDYFNSTFSSSKVLPIVFNTSLMKDHFNLELKKYSSLVIQIINLINHKDPDNPFNYEIKKIEVFSKSEYSEVIDGVVDEAKKLNNNKPKIKAKENNKSSLAELVKLKKELKIVKENYTKFNNLSYSSTSFEKDKKIKKALLSSVKEIKKLEKKIKEMSELN